MIDLRSDTVTRPTEAMKAAMQAAPVGDDVFAEDPSINALQEEVAAMFGKEAALFCPSGTMTNQIAINVHTRPGDDVICASVAHIYLYEGGGVARNSGCSVRLLEGDRGRLSADEIEANVNRRQDTHLPFTRLVSLEDTVNKGGGCYYDHAEILRIKEVCNRHDLGLHLDGARLFNALVETGMSPEEYAKPFDSISICLSKGLGAPVGSLVIGSRDFIHRAHRVRKVFGGGMRQAGSLAEAGRFALKHHVERLRDDHRRARTLGEALQKCHWVSNVMRVDTNIVIFSTNASGGAAAVVDALNKAGILCFAFGKEKVRFVTHLDFTEDHLEQTLNILPRIQV